MTKNILLNNNEIKIAILFKSGALGYKINDLSYVIVKNNKYNHTLYSNVRIEMPEEYKIKYFVKLTSKLTKVN